jgi:predicted TIM-barrel fold metal-dependent hydrolase
MIDSHCHPLTEAGGPLDLAEVSLQLAPDEQARSRRAASAPFRLSQELMGVRLAGHLGCAVEELATARERASADWPAYVSSLFRISGLRGLVLDPGWDPAASSAKSEVLAALTGCQVRTIMRLDPMVDQMIGEGATATEVLTAVERAVREAPAQGYVGLKTILAYRTGLAVDPTATLATAEESLRDKGLPLRRRGKALRDLLTRRVLGWAAELKLPLQIHTGLGDSEIRLAEANPLLLEDLLMTPEGGAATVVLIHGSYPWHEELAYLTLVKSNLYAELSLFNIFAPATVATRLERILELAPADRVLCGTDGHGTPESFWFGALLLQEAWAKVRDSWLGQGARATWLSQVETAIFEGNTASLYHF